MLFELIYRYLYQLAGSSIKDVLTNPNNDATTINTLLYNNFIRDARLPFMTNITTAVNAGNLDLFKYGLLASLHDLIFIVLPYFYTSFASVEQIECFVQIRELYNSFIDVFLVMIKDFGFDKTVQIFMVYVHLLENGYLSGNNNSDPNVKEYIDIPFYYGASVFTGEACCRHNSALLADILNKSGNQTTTLSVGDGWILPNHMITASLTEHNETLFFDPEWNTIGERRGPFIYDICTGEMLYKLFGPFSSAFSSSTSMLKKKAIKRPPIIETDRIRLAKEEAQKIIGDNSDIIQQFVKETKEMREELRAKTLKFKQLETRQ